MWFVLFSVSFFPYFSSSSSLINIVAHERFLTYFCLSPAVLNAASVCRMVWLRVQVCTEFSRCEESEQRPSIRTHNLLLSNNFWSNLFRWIQNFSLEYCIVVFSLSLFLPLPLCLLSSFVYAPTPTHTEFPLSTRNHIKFLIKKLFISVRRMAQQKIKIKKTHRIRISVCIIRFSVIACAKAVRTRS